MNDISIFKWVDRHTKFQLSNDTSDISDICSSQLLMINYELHMYMHFYIIQSCRHIE